MLGLMVAENVFVSLFLYLRRLVRPEGVNAHRFLDESLGRYAKNHAWQPVL